MSTDTIIVNTWDEAIDALFNHPNDQVILSLLEIEAGDSTIRQMKDFLHSTERLTISHVRITVDNGDSLGILGPLYLTHLIENKACLNAKVTLDCSSDYLKKRTEIQMAIMEGQDRAKRYAKRDEEKRNDPEAFERKLNMYKDLIIRDEMPHMMFYEELLTKMADSVD